MDVLTHFNLIERPFELGPNLHYFHQAASHMAALETLLQSLNSRDGLSIIYGDIGTGKTMLKRKLASLLDAERFTVLMISSPNFSMQTLYKEVAHLLGITLASESDEHQTLTAIETALEHIQAQGKRTVLLIDEAQSLSNECLEALRLLTNWNQQGQGLLQVVLFAQSELEERLAAWSLRSVSQRVCCVFHLQPLARGEVQAYLNDRLAVAGYQGKVLFPHCSLLYSVSLGVPRVLNAIASNALKEAAALTRDQVSKKVLKKAIKNSAKVIATVVPETEQRPWWIWLCAGVVALAGIGVAIFLLVSG